MRPANMRPAHKGPTHERPAHMHATHMTPDDEAAMDAMPTKRRAVEEALAIEVAAIRPSPAIPVMSPTRPAMNLVDKVTIFDGVTQAVGATKRDGSGGLGKRAGSHDGCGCNSHCKNPHGFPPEIERADRPSHRTFG